MSGRYIVKKIVLLASLIAIALGATGVVSIIVMPEPVAADKPVTLPDDWSQCVFPPYDC